MTMFLGEVPPTVESPLVDLCAVPLAALRQMNSALFDSSLRHVVDQTRHLLVCADSGGAERIA